MGLICASTMIMTSCPNNNKDMSNDNSITDTVDSKTPIIIEKHILIGIDETGNPIYETIEVAYYEETTNKKSFINK